MEKDRDTNVAELTDCNVKVVTLMDLKIRRQELLRKKQKVLDRMLPQNPSPISHPLQPTFEALTTYETTDIDIANCDTLIFDTICSTTVSPDDAEETVTYPLNNSINEPLAIPDIAEETINIRINISPDDSIADSNFVPLSDITNVEPMLSNDLNSFPEQNLEADAAKASRKRKRKADRETWKRDLNRKDRMLGKAYTGFKKVNNKYIQNEPKPKRTMGPKCSSSFCARSKILFCSNLTEETRQQIFKRFWNMTWKEKKMYVRSMVDTQIVKRKTTGSESRRSETKLYYLQINGKKERVCLKSFLATLAIKEWTVRYWICKTVDVNSDHTNFTPSLPTSKQDSVKSYLNLLPKLPSHYCRQSSTKQYLEPLLQSKSQLYKLYVEYASSASMPVASRKLFLDILAEQNIALFQPKKDACDYCSSYKAGNVREEDYQRHIQLKNLARSEKTNDKELAKCGKIHTLTADLQAVKLCPSLSASALYFKTKLAVHNFTVYNLGTNEVTCYWFDETACDLKATTYASFFVDYLRNLLSENLKDVVIWTDGCTAQNRNAVVSNALLRLAMDKNVTITQKYLEKGHTQMEVDSVHSLVERKLQNIEIFLPSQYASLTKEARKKPFPYKVIQPDHTFFKDYSAKEYQVYDSIRPGRSSGDNCVVDLRVLKYNANGTIEFKKHFDEEFRPLPRRPRNISTLISEVPFLYSSRLPILESKYLHLQQLKTVIPSDCHHFYDNLPFHKK
ncbi:unnamed protein product [Chilo suppressalis]|uniref:Uncharacterized protein n=1 Tax=Chilo suppressalis TaxID=168631 RepID=A0ABN8L7R9_CHISP|nr:unnamed protein product [Chilo suppressalis]